MMNGRESIELNKNQTKEQMANYGVGYRMMPWAIGDLWNLSVTMHGEDWCLQHLAPMSGLKPSHLLDFSMLSRRFPNEEYRHYGLSIWHHRDVVSMPPKPREQLLKLAETHKLTTVQLRRIKKAWKNAHGAEDLESLVLHSSGSVEGVSEA